MLMVFDGGFHQVLTSMSDMSGMTGSDLVQVLTCLVSPGSFHHVPSCQVCQVAPKKRSSALLDYHGRLRRLVFAYWSLTEEFAPDPDDEKNTEALTMGDKLFEDRRKTCFSHFVMLCNQVRTWMNVVFYKSQTWLNQQGIVFFGNGDASRTPPRPNVFSGVASFVFASFWQVTQEAEDELREVYNVPVVRKLEKFPWKKLENPENRTGSTGTKTDTT